MSKVTATAIAPYKQAIDRAMPSIQAVLPTTIAKYLTPNRIAKTVMLAMTRNLDLLECSTESVIRCIMESAEMGLEIGGSLGHAYMVPFAKNATLIIGYRGYITLARRSGEVLSVEAHVVFEKDKFVLRYGTDPELSHVPCLEGDPGKPVGVYSIAMFRDGGRHVEFMTINAVNKIRGRSKTANKGPWVTDYEEMAKKTVVRRAAKYWPISTEIARAFDTDNSADTSDIVEFDPLTGVVTEVNSEPIKGGVASLKEKLSASNKNSVDAPEVDQNTGEVIPENAGVSEKDQAIDASEIGG
jgi:recombination protein RecT